MGKSLFVPPTWRDSRPSWIASIHWGRTSSCLTPTQQKHGRSRVDGTLFAFQSDGTLLDLWTSAERPTNGSCRIDACRRPFSLRRDDADETRCNDNRRKEPPNRQAAAESAQPTCSVRPRGHGCAAGF